MYKDQKQKQVFLDKIHALGAELDCFYKINIVPGSGDARKAVQVARRIHELEVPVVRFTEDQLEQIRSRKEEAKQVIRELGWR